MSAETNRSDFDGLSVYQTIAEMIVFIDGLQDRFAQDDLPVLFAPMRAAALEAGAQLAAGFGRDGLDHSGKLSEQTRRDVAGKLGELRHYVLTAAAGFLLDEKHAARFESLYDLAKTGISAPAVFT